METVQQYYGSLACMLKKFDKYARQDAFQGITVAEFEIWRTQARQHLYELLGLQFMEKVSPCAYKMQSNILLENGVVREKWRIQTEPDVWMPFYILHPTKIESETRCFLCFPGHQGAGKESVAGRTDIPAVANAIKKYEYDYGLQLALQGHWAICPDCRGFGERRDEALQNDEESSYMNGTCFQLSHMAESMGQTVAGMCTWDYMRLIDWMEQEQRWDMKRLSCLGFSGGGMQSLWLAALDDRVQLAVISGYFYGYKDSLLVLNSNCSCNYVPGLFRHYDMCDLASLIAPRPLVIQSCRDDHLNGARGINNVLEQMQHLKKQYLLFQSENHLCHDICEGGHQWHGEHIPMAIKKVLECNDDKCNAMR